MPNGRVVIGTMGMDQHELGAIAVARILRDAGMEVVYAGRFNTPHSLVRIAVDEDADVIGVSCHSWEYVQYIPELLRLLEEFDAEASVVLGGSVITTADAEMMKHEGVAAVFLSGASAEEIVSGISALVRDRQDRLATAV